MKKPLRCLCGQKLTAGKSTSKNSKKYWYYVCPEHQQNLSAIRLHGQSQEVLQIIQFTEEDLASFRSEIEKRFIEKSDDRSRELDLARRELRTLENKIVRMEEKYLGGADISEKTFSDMMAKLRLQAAGLKKQIAEATVDMNKRLKMMEKVLPKLNQLAGLYDKMPLEKKKHLLTVLFGDFLYYREGAYRTPSPDFLVRRKEQELKEKGLLFVEQPFVKFTPTPGSAPGGS